MMNTTKRLGYVAVIATALLLFAVTPILAQAANAVEVSDQAVADNTLTIDSVTIDQAGWVVIHENACDNFGDAIGQAVLESGDATDVEVTLNEGVEVAEGDSLCAMLHTDAGTAGTFDFPDSDPPLQDEDGNVIMTTFSVQAETAAQEATATPEATETVTDTETMTPTETMTATATAEATPETLPETGGTGSGGTAGLPLMVLGLVALLGAAGVYLLQRSQQRA